MNIQDKKQDIDLFIKDLFHGFSTLITANATYENAPVALSLLNEKDSEHTVNNIPELLIGLMGDIGKYALMEEPDEKLIHNMYSSILGLRMVGVIVNNNDSISSLKMEKLRLEDKTRKLEKDNELLAEQLASCRSLLDSKKVDFKAVG